MLPSDPKKSRYLGISWNGTVNQVSKHFVEDIHAHTQFGYAVTRNGQVGYRVGHARMVTRAITMASLAWQLSPPFFEFHAGSSRLCGVCPWQWQRDPGSGFEGVVPG